MQEAIVRYGAPEVFNTDQGAQFTSQAVHRCAQGARCAHLKGQQGSLAGQRVRGAPLAQPQQEEVYRRAYETVGEAEKWIADYLRYLNKERPHQRLDNRTPDDVFYKRKPLSKAT